MSLPQLAALEFDSKTDVVTTSAEQIVNATFDWDFETGDFRLVDGSLKELTGQDYLHVWIQKTLRTIKNSLIYAGTGYGSEHYSIVGRNFDPAFLRAEYERMTRECLMENSAITDISDIRLEQDGAQLKISLSVASIFGSGSVEI